MRAYRSNDLVALPAGRFLVGEIFARMRLLGVPVLADVGIRVLLLIQIAECVVDFSVLAFVCSNCDRISEYSFKSGLELTVIEHVEHRALAFRHFPIIDGNFWCLEVLPLW